MSSWQGQEPGAPLVPLSSLGEGRTCRGAFVLLGDGGRWRSVGGSLDGWPEQDGQSLRLTVTMLRARGPLLSMHGQQPVPNGGLRLAAPRAMIGRQTGSIQEGERAVNADALMNHHVRALFTLDRAGRLETVNDAGGAAAPRFFLGRTAEGYRWWFRHDVDEALAEELASLGRAQTPGVDLDEGGINAAPFVECLGRVEPVRKVWTGPAFHLPPDLAGSDRAVMITPANAAVLSPYLDEWSGDVSPHIPMLGVLVEGLAVSVCCSVRVTRQAHEAGVETHPDFRGRGHATDATREWGRVVRELGAIPLYSTSWANHASRALARKLGLMQFGADLHIS